MISKLDSIFGTRTTPAQEKYDVFYKEMIRIVVDVDENRLGWLTKNIKQLDYTDYTEFANRCVYEILQIPMFAIQVVWFNALLNTRCNGFVCSLINALGREGFLAIKTLHHNPAHQIFKINLTFAREGYSIEMNFFIDEKNSFNSLGVIFWAFFINGCYDTVITPSLVWKQLKTEFGLQKLKDSILIAGNLCKVYEVFYSDVIKNYHGDLLFEITSCFYANAKEYEWVDFYDDMRSKYLTTQLQSMPSVILH
jgi:hypothetical protein